jgi:hypothetical protein
MRSLNFASATLVALLAACSGAGPNQVTPDAGAGAPDSAGLDGTADDATGSDGAVDAADAGAALDADPGYFDITKCEPSDGQAPTSVLVLEGDIVDPLALSASEETFTDQDGWRFFGAAFGAEVGVTSRAAGYQYVVWFADTDGGAPSLGDYPHASSTTDDGGIDTDGAVGIYLNAVPLAHRIDMACKYMTGSFFVKDLQWSPDHSAIRSFLASFQRYCNDKLPVLRGCVHYVGN